MFHDSHSVLTIIVPTPSQVAPCWSSTHALINLHVPCTNEWQLRTVVFFQALPGIAGKICP